MAEFEYKTFSLHIKSSHIERKQQKSARKKFVEYDLLKKKVETGKLKSEQIGPIKVIHKVLRAAQYRNRQKVFLSFPFVALSKYKNNFRQSSVMFSKIIKPIKIISESIFLPLPLAPPVCVCVSVDVPAGRMAKVFCQTFILDD